MTMASASGRLAFVLYLLVCAPFVWSGRSVSVQIAAIFASVDNVDMVVDSDAEFECTMVQGFYGLSKTVRLYRANENALCDAIPQDRSPPVDHFRQMWEQNQRGGYVIITNGTTLLSYACLLDPFGTYLLANRADTGDLLALEQQLDWLWAHRGVFRTFAIVGESIYTYDPFQPTNWPSFGQLLNLGVHDPPTIPTNDFRGFPVKVEIFRATYSDAVSDGNGNVFYKGADVTARDVFFQSINLTASHIDADRDLFGDRLPNGSYSGALGRAIRHESDIIFTGFFIKDYFTRDIEYTAGVYSDEICCLVKKASRIPEYLLPLSIFPVDIWTLLAIVGILCSLSWITLRWLIRRSKRYRIVWAQNRRLAYLFNLSHEIRRASKTRQAAQIFIDTFILLVSGPYQRFTRSGIERLFLTGIVLVSLIFVSIFQSSLASVFVNPLYYKDIASLSQLDESNMRIPVKYRGFMDDVFPANYSPMMDSLRSKMVHRVTKESMLGLVARVDNMATVTRRTTLSLDNAIFMTSRQLFMIPECPRKYMLAYVTPRHSVFLERFNRVLLRMLNGGLINHWIDEMYYGWTLHNRRLVQRMQESNFKVLTVIDMQFPFYLLAIGVITSVVVFVAEFIHHRYG